MKDKVIAATKWLIGTKHGAMVLIVILVLALVGLNTVLAHDINIDNSVTNNYYGYDENGSGGTLTAGLSDSEIAELLTIGVAAGSHQLDFSTQDWQGSVTGAFYDGEDAVSFGVGKRWDKFGKVLLHGSYTQKSGEDLWVVGGTFRF